MFADANVANFISHPSGARIFHNAELARHYFTSATADISLISPSPTGNSRKPRAFCAKPVEKFTKLCYNELDKLEFKEKMTHEYRED